MRSRAERSNDPGLLVLTSLASGPKPGYAITVDVEQFSGVRLGEPRGWRNEQADYAVDAAPTSAIGYGSAVVWGIAGLG
jgi:hypothetical protein